MFHFAMQGVTQAKVRWEKCVKYVNDRMGLAVGRLFIKENFDEHSKHTALEMIHNIRDAFNEILLHSDWMDEETSEHHPTESVLTLAKFPCTGPNLQNGM